MTISSIAGIGRHHRPHPARATQPSAAQANSSAPATRTSSSQAAAAPSGTATAQKTFMAQLASRIG